MQAYVNAFVEVWLELAPWLLVGAAVAGLLHVILPPDFVKRHMAGRGSILKAVALGVPLPLCSCGVIPAGLGLKKDGASDAASVSFLVSTPQTGVDSVLVSAAFLGWPFALFKVGAAAVTGIVGGALTEHFGGPRQAYFDESEHDAGSSTANRRSFAAFIEHAEDLIRSIWGWLLVGVAVSAAITAWVPPSAFDSLSGFGGLVTMLAVLLISLPLYVCATSSVPIAAALVAGGLPTGAALVFLMAGPASNVATIGAIHRAFGKRVLSLYLGTIVIGSIAMGLLFDSIIPEAADLGHVHEGHTAEWAIVGGILLALMVLRYAIDDLRRLIATRGLAQSSSEDALVLNVSGMTCGGCVSKLEGVLKNADGIDRAVVTLDPGKAIIHGPLGRDAVHTLIESAGFQVVPKG